jgi:hypothetical protein
MPRASKRPTAADMPNCINGFCVKEKSPGSILIGESGCLGTYLATHQGRFTIAPPVKTPNEPQVCQVRQRVPREGGGADKRSACYTGMPEHVSVSPSAQIRNRRARRNSERAADMLGTQTRFLKAEAAATSLACEFPALGPKAVPNSLQRQERTAPVQKYNRNKMRRKQRSKKSNVENFNQPTSGSSEWRTSRNRNRRQMNRRRSNMRARAESGFVWRGSRLPTL